MKSITASFILICSLALSGCGFTGFHIVTGSQNVIQETRLVSGFDSIDMTGSGDLIITQGNEEGIKIEAEDNLMPYIRTEVRGHTLHIYMDSTNLLSIEVRQPMKFYVSMKDVASLDLSGSGKIISTKIDAKKLDVNISGSGEVRIDDLTADSMSLDMSGSGQCDINGVVPVQKMSISGSGKCDLIRLEGKDVDIDISGSGAAFVNAANTLNVRISGSGDITYTGSPKLTQDITGSGRLNSR
jgi:hypothetical protein